MRDVTQYADPSHIAKAIKFMLEQIPQLAISELVIDNR